MGKDLLKDESTTKRRFVNNRQLHPNKSNIGGEFQSRVCLV